MKIPFKKALWIGLAAIVACGGLACWWAAVRGRAFVAGELSRATGRAVTIYRVLPAFPAGVRMDGLVIDGLLKAPRVWAQMDIPALLGGHLVLASLELDSPEINVDAGHVTGHIVGPVVAGPSLAADVTSAKVPKTGIVLAKVRLNDGIVMLQLPSAGKTWILEHVGADIDQVPLDGTPLRTVFHVKASLRQLSLPFLGPFLRADGWVNWAVRDMAARAQMSDEEGRNGLEAILIAKADDLDVNGIVLFRKDQPKHASAAKPRMLEGTTLDLLAATDTDIDVRFSFKTRLDHFDPGEIKVEGKVTTGLHSNGLSGNIVGNLKAAGKKWLNSQEIQTIKPFKQ